MSQGSLLTLLFLPDEIYQTEIAINVFFLFLPISGFSGSVFKITIKNLLIITMIVHQADNL